MIWALLLATACRESVEASETAPTKRDAPRIVALGDLHADYAQATKVLAGVGLIDVEGHWVGGKAVLVQTGDVMDRGPDSHKLIRFLARLATEAESAGGQVVPLLGNHEVMNLRGDWRYVDTADVQQYGGREARRQSLAPDGEDGKYLRSLSAVAHIDGTVFVHGGVHPDFANRPLDETNAAIRAAIDAPAALPAAVLGEQGPLWYRGYVLDPEPQACARLAEALDQLKAERMVVGHTTQRDGVVRSRCEGRLFAIDVGIAGPYGHHTGALEIVGDAVTALYLDPDGSIRRQSLTPQ
ncbi:MAG: metallophosphoesterase [Myxococcota bacterium]